MKIINDYELNNSNNYSTWFNYALGGVLIIGGIYLISVLRKKYFPK
jgi:hypothetical protein